jgi:hypothetical protein
LAVKEKIKLDKIKLTEIKQKISHQQLLQRIWAIGLMESWFCIWDDLANPLKYQNDVRHFARTKRKKN